MHSVKQAELAVHHGRPVLLRGDAIHLLRGNVCCVCVACVLRVCSVCIKERMYCTNVLVCACVPVLVWVFVHVCFVLVCVLDRK